MPLDAFSIRRRLDCVFTGKSGAASHYIGRLTNVGPDIGIAGSGQSVWGVPAATKEIGPGGLAGDRAGAQGAAGIGGAALGGGSNKMISLQPASVSAQMGPYLSAGVINIRLQYVPVTRPPVEVVPPKCGKRQQSEFFEMRA